MAEYAVVTAVMAALVVSLSSIPDSQLSARLPTTVQRATALATQSAKAAKLPVRETRAVVSRAPYARPPLKYLYAAGWIGGRQRPADCVFAKVTPGPWRERILQTVRRDAKLVTRLRRMHVTVGRAADALTSGMASAC